MAKILLVEDDDNLREIYQARLIAEGYDIVTAQNGEEALVVAKQHHPDLIISDVMMPRISGFEMLDILRNTEELKDTKVIILTALGQAEDQDRAGGLGANRYLVKSQVTLEDIVKASQDMLAGATIVQPAADDTTDAAADDQQAATDPLAPAASTFTEDTSANPVAPTAPSQTTPPLQNEPMSPSTPQADATNDVAVTPQESPKNSTVISVADPDPIVSEPSREAQSESSPATPEVPSILMHNEPLMPQADDTPVLNSEAPAVTEVNGRQDPQSPPSPAENPDQSFATSFKPDVHESAASQQLLAAEEKVVEAASQPITDETAIVEAQIESYLASTPTTSPQEPIVTPQEQATAPTEQTPSSPEPTPPAPDAVEQSNDKTLSDALNELKSSEESDKPKTSGSEKGGTTVSPPAEVLTPDPIDAPDASTRKSTTSETDIPTTGAAVSPDIQPSPETTAQTDTSPPTDSQASDATASSAASQAVAVATPASPTIESDQVAVAGKKVIQPLNAAENPKRNLQELLAEEEAKENGLPVTSVPTAPPPIMPQSSTHSDNTVDPDSIAL
ncbi:MAG: response regulator [Candidatus Saccharimonadales bacterium]